MRPRCKVCGALYFWWNGSFCSQEYCAQGHPPRASKVFHHEAPKWLRTALNVGYAEEIRGHFRGGYYGVAKRTKLGSKAEAVDFMLNHVCRHPHLFDHWGRDAEENLISEPYAGDREIYREKAANFAQRIGADLAITNLTWHAPWIPECIRFTFSCQLMKEF
jgi:hypothetical protein